ncbi:MAG: RidA family protein [Lachnospirales bacterium]
MLESIKSTNAPGAIGPYSQAILAGNTIYVSGQLPINSETGEFAGEDIKSQTKQSLENAKAILEEAGYKMSDVAKTTVYLDNIEDFVAMNEVYNTFFSEPYPARASFEVGKLPKNALVEIEVIAYKK